MSTHIAAMPESVTSQSFPTMGLHSQFSVEEAVISSDFWPPVLVLTSSQIARQGSIGFSPVSKWFTLTHPNLQSSYTNNSSLVYMFFNVTLH